LENEARLAALAAAQLLSNGFCKASRPSPSLRRSRFHLIGGDMLLSCFWATCCFSSQCCIVKGFCPFCDTKIKAV